VGPSPTSSQTRARPRVRPWHDAASTRAAPRAHRGPLGHPYKAAAPHPRSSQPIVAALTLQTLAAQARRRCTSAARRAAASPPSAIEQVPQELHVAVRSIAGPFSPLPRLLARVIPRRSFAAARHRRAPLSGPRLDKPSP
jgi:hypothetical protein